MGSDTNTHPAAVASLLRVDPRGRGNVGLDLLDTLDERTHALIARGLVYCSGQGARDPASGEVAGLTWSGNPAHLRSVAAAMDR